MKTKRILPGLIVALAALASIVVCSSAKDPNFDIFGVLSAADTDPTDLHPDDKLGLYGALSTDATVHQAFALPAAALAPFDTHVITSIPSSALLTGLPPIGTQGKESNLGSPGSCEAWSFGYGLGSYTASRRPNRTLRFDATQSQNTASAAYLYMAQLSEIGQTCPKGTGAIWYLERLVTTGAPSTTQVPYKACCSCLESIDLGRSFSDLSKFQIGSFAQIQLGQSPDVLNRMKAYLANGQAIAFSGLVLQGYATAPVIANGVMTNSTPIANSGHGQLIVGYDDTKGDPSSPGAFLVQNSFGSSWPCTQAGLTGTACTNPGQIWWPYQTWLATQSYAAIAFPVNPNGTTGLGLLTGASTNPSTAPTAAIAKAWQWTPTGSSGQSALILWHEFSQPVKLVSITLTEPSTTTTATIPFDQSIRSGYTYASRFDSHAFLHGTWQVSIAATALDGTALSYSGSITVPATTPNASLSETSMSGVELTAPGGEKITP